MHKHRLFNTVMVALLLLGLLSSACAQPTAPATQVEEQAPAEVQETEAPAAEAPQSDVELVFVWHSGGLGEKFEELAKEYTAMTGVKVRADLVPYGPQWHDKIAAEFAARGSGFDLAMFDS
jgi:multiple sugar transport system substrate-binding protein